MPLAKLIEGLLYRGCYSMDLMKAGNTGLLDERAVPSTFRLLDLPAEIRNQIYQEALTFESHQYYGTRTCSVALLSTCKQVHNEAQEFLYMENEVVIRLATAAGPDPIVTLTANGEEVSYYKNDHWKLQVQWPHFVLKIGKIRIGCSFNHRNDSAHGNRCMITANNILYDLNYFLLGNSNLGTIRIDVTNNSWPVTAEMAEMLSPLSLFGERAQLDFQGIPPYMIQRLLVESVQSAPNSRMNIFEVYNKLRREAFSCLSLCSEAADLPKSVLVAQDLLYRTEQYLPSTAKLMTAQSDKHLKRLLCDLDTALSNVDFDAIVAAPKWQQEPASWYHQSLNRLRNRQMLTSDIATSEPESV